MSDPQNPDTPSNPETAHKSLIEHPLPSAVSTQVFHPGFAGMQDDDADTIDLREYWHIIVKRKWTVISFFLIVVIAVATATFLMTPIYRATTVLQIEREAAKVVEFKDVSPTESVGDRDFYQTQYELLKSNTLAQRVIEQLGLEHRMTLQDRKDASLSEWFADNFGGGSKESIAVRDKLDRAGADSARTRRVQNFLNDLTVLPVRNSRLVKVSYDAPDPVLAASVANAIAQNFIGVNLERRFDASSYAKTFLEERIKQVKSKLEETERAQVEYARSQEIFSVDKDGVTTDAQNLQEFNTALARVQQERIKAESLYMQLQANKSGELPQLLENQLLQQYKGNKAKWEAEYQDKLKVFKPGYPAMQQLAGQIAELTAQIDTEKENIRNSIKASYEAAKSQEAMILDKLGASKKNMLDMQTRSIQFNILKREADTNRQLYDGLLQRLKEVSVAGGVGTNNVSVVDRAEVPTTKFKPSLSLNLMLAMFFGLFGGVGLAFFFEHLDDTFKSALSVEKQLQLAVLGIIPTSNEMRQGQTVLQLLVNDTRSALAESYRSVRTALQFSREGGAPKLLGVTSSNMGEGKSTTAVSLAIQFAQFGSRVLLIDADLRNPSLHKVFGVENDIGLTNYLAGTTQPAAMTRNTPVSNLFFVSTGPLPPNPAELLSSNRMNALLELASSKFDLVVIDSPPILGLADALVVANMVESMLLVIEAGQTRRNTVQAALKRLTAVRARPLGCLLTKMQSSTQGYGYGYGEYYYAYGGKSAENKKKLAT